MEKWENVICVTNRRLCEGAFLEQIDRICSLHPAKLILREKDLSEAAYEELAIDVRNICASKGVPCVLHTYDRVAEKLQMQAVHLPLPVLETINLEDNNAIGGKRRFREIGASVHSVNEALRAVQLGATYLTAGHVYVTDCKKGLPPRGIEFLREVCEAVSVPVYGIGGIHPGTGQIEELMACGAAGGCMMSELMRWK